MERIPNWLWVLVAIAVFAFVGNALGLFTIDFGVKLGK